MKLIPIFLSLLAAIGHAETTDDIARNAIALSAPAVNFSDNSPEGQRKALLKSSAFSLAVYMQSKDVPERIRLAFALKVLTEQLRGSVGKANGSVLEIDEIETAKMRERIAAQIVLLENRIVAIHQANQTNKSAEQDGADQPATAPESKSEGQAKPQLESKPAPR